jgi:hypothetical protein
MAFIFFEKKFWEIRIPALKIFIVKKGNIKHYSGKDSQLILLCNSSQAGIAGNLFCESPVG